MAEPFLPSPFLSRPGSASIGVRPEHQRADGGLGHGNTFPAGWPDYEHAEPPMGVSPSEAVMGGDDPADGPMPSFAGGMAEI